MTAHPHAGWVADPLAGTVCLSAAPTSAIAPGPDNTVIIARTGRRSTISRLDAGVRAAICAIGRRRHSWAGLVELARERDPHADTVRLEKEVRRLVGKGDVRLSCHGPHGEQLVAAATSSLADPRFVPAPAEASLSLSRFTICVRGDDGLALDSPLRHFRVTVRAPSLGSAVIRLGSATSVKDLVSACGDADESWLRTSLDFLFSLGLLQAGAEGPEQEQREMPDVLLHARSRRGMTDGQVGASSRFAGRFPPLPALKPAARNGNVSPVRLPRPDLGHLRQADLPLTAVIESRRSVREYGERPVTVDQLGEFLYRTARADGVMPSDERDNTSYEMTRRPYPTGGAVHDLEIYLTVRVCDGLPTGFYHYDPADHELHSVSRQRDIVEAFLREAYVSAAQLCVPQVLITMASRFARSSWRYEAISYALTLKNVGVLYAHMYLVATAMGLAPCALGSGDSSIFARATGLDPIAESSVGEFMLGSLPDGHQTVPDSEGKRTR